MSLQEPKNWLQSHPLNVGAGERKQLTILYYDLVGSFSLLRTLGDPEAFLEILRFMHDKFEVHLSCRGGTKFQMEGDGALYLFGWPAIEGNPAERSAHAAFDILNAANKLNDELKLVLPSGWKLEIRVTIASDLTVITKNESEMRIVGNAMNLPSRLKSVCERGRILIDATTKDRLGRAFLVTPFEPQSFHGIEGKVETFHLVEPLPGVTKLAARTADRSRLFVGRVAEMAELRKQWLLACEGQGQIGFLVGPAGIGKSRLALAVSHLARKKHVLSYQCSDLYRSSALYPFLDRLRRDARIRHLDLPEQQIAKLRKLLRAHPSDVDDDLCRYLLDIEVGSAENRKREELRENAFQRMIEQLKRMTARRPYLFLIEDLQWIDPTSRELLDAVIKLAMNLPLFVLVTSRPTPAAESMIDALRDKENVGIYRLGPLNDEHNSAIIANAFEGMHCPPSVTAAIIKRAQPDCLPFYIEELARFVRDKLENDGGQWTEVNAPQVIGGSLPVSLEMFLRESLDRLSPSAKDIVQIASAVGPNFSRDLLESLCPLETKDFEAGLTELCDSRLIHKLGDAVPVQYQFRHELLRDAAYQSMLRSTRQRLHQDIANTLCTSHPQIAGQMPEFVAHHWTEAGDAEQAIKYWSAAGERAAMRSAAKEAFGHFHRAIGLLDRIKDRPGAAETELTLRNKASGVETAISGWSAQASQCTYARILELSTNLNRANEQFMAHLGLANSLYVNGKLDEALTHGRACLDMAERTKSADQFLHGHRILSEISFYIGAFAQCCEHANESIARYRVEDHYRLIGGIGDDPKVLCLMYRALSHWILGRADLSLADCEEAIALAGKLGHAYSAAQAQFYASWLYAIMRDTGLAELFASRSIASCKEGGFDLVGGLAQVIHGWAIRLGPDPAGAMAEVSRGIEQIRAPEADICLSCFLPWLAEMHLLVGNIDEGLATMREAHELAEETFYTAERLRVEGDLRAANDRAGAAACFARALETARHQGSIAFELRTTLSMCKNRFCDVRDLQPLLKRMVGTIEDHDLRDALKMVSLAS